MIETMPKIEWVIKKRPATSKSACDVSVNVRHNAKKRQVAIIFRNKCTKDIEHTGYLRVGVYSGVRLYFMPANAATGYKLAEVNSGNKQVVVPGTDDLMSFKGNYDFEYDADNAMFFIDKRHQRSANAD